MIFGVVSVTAETDCSLTVPLSVTAVSGKTTFGRSLGATLQWPYQIWHFIQYVFSHLRATM